MKRLVFAALAAAALGSTAASAQGVQIGPGGVRVDPGYDRRDNDRDERRWDHERRWREGRHGGGCRTIIVKKEDDFGRRVTKRIERCD
jgi:Ni/Co efflux regulator RcnB